MQIKAEDLIEFVRTQGPLQLVTDAQRKPFTIRAFDNGLEITPSSSNRSRKHKLKWLRKVCEKFSETHSFRSADYRAFTANPSYSVAILRAYLGQGKYPGNQISMSMEALQASQAREVKKSLNDSVENRRARLAAAPKKPFLKLVTTVVFTRNPDVIAEVLTRACGKCEECGNEAPFLRNSDDSPYLEVHHKIQLASGGEDTVENAIALCPNCHRRSHYG